jgi:hypothetical protein
MIKARPTRNGWPGLDLRIEPERDGRPMHRRESVVI